MPKEINVFPHSIMNGRNRPRSQGQRNRYKSGGHFNCVGFVKGMNVNSFSISDRIFHYLLLNSWESIIDILTSVPNLLIMHCIVTYVRHDILSVKSN